MLTKHLPASDEILNQMIQLLFVSEFLKTRDVDIKYGPLLSAAVRVHGFLRHNHHTQTVLARIREEQRKRGREMDREGGVAFIYVLAMQKDDFSSF